MAAGAVPDATDGGDSSGYLSKNGGFLKWGSPKPLYRWPFQEPKLEVPTIYKAYVRLM